MFGQVSSIAGTATVKDANGQIRQLKLGDEVHAGDVVSTSAGSRVQIDCADQSSFEIPPNAEFLIAVECLSSEVDGSEWSVSEETVGALAGAIESGDGVDFLEAIRTGDLVPGEVDGDELLEAALGPDIDIGAGPSGGAHSFVRLGRIVLDLSEQGVDADTDAEVSQEEVVGANNLEVNPEPEPEPEPEPPTPEPAGPVILSITGPESVLEGDVTAPYTLSLVDDEGNAIVAETDIVVTVTYTGTATDGSDYTSETPITIAAGSSSATFDLQTLDDVIADNGETIVLTISTEDDGGFEDLQLGNDEVTTIIIDDSNPDTPDNPDEPDQEAVTLSITGPESVLEGDVTAPYTLSLVDDEGNAIVAETDIVVTVTYTGTATDGSDYTSETPITIAAGSSSATFDLQTLDDVIADNGETIVLTISTEDDGGFEDLQLGNDEVTTIIIDDSNPDTPDNPDEPDQEAVTLSITGPESVLEGDVTAPYTLSLVDDEGNAIVAETDIVVTVTYTGTATDGSDYTSETPITIAAGSSSATFDLQTLDDVIADNGETIVLTISTEDDGGFEDLQLGNDEVTTIIIDDSNPDTPDNPDEPDQEAVTLSITGPESVLEGDVTAPYTLSLVDDEGNAIVAETDIIITVTYTGTATDGSDYTSETPITIAAGSSSATFDLQTLDDVIADNGETIVLTISTEDDGGFEDLQLGNDEVTTIIIDDSNPDTPDNPDEPDQEAVTLSITGPESVLEGDVTAPYTLSLVDDEGNAIVAETDIIITVTYTGTATDGSDYTSETPITIAAGSSSATFDLQTLDDVIADNGETIVLTISTEDDGGFEDLQLGNDEVTTIIIDADIPLVSISGEYTIIEGETSGTFTVAVDQPASEITSDITVALIYSGVAQDGTDFTGVASVTIAAGTNNVEFTIDTIDDALAEGSESLVITIGEITDTNFEAIAADPDANSVENEIIDETGEDPENPPDVAYRLGLFAVVDGEYVAANEIWEDGGVGTYVVLAVDENGEPLADAEQPGGTVTVAIGPQDGEDNPEVDAANTAERGIDYDSSETVVATVGATFTIAAIDDVLADNGEVFTLALSEDWSRANEFEDVDYVGGVTTTILDETSNDPGDPNDNDAVTLNIAGPSSVFEGDVTAPYTLSLVDDEGNAIVAETDVVVIVTYTGTATDGSDYTSETPITIAAGSSSATFDLQTLDDSIADNGETIVLTISTEDDGGFEAIELGNSEVTTTILDNVEPVVISLEGPSDVVEGETTAAYTVSLSEAIPSFADGGSDIVVTLTYTYTTAEEEDITETATVTIAAGSDSATFTIDTIDDALAEGAEDFVVSITEANVADSNFEAIEVSETANSVTTTITDQIGPDTPPGPEDTVVISLEGPSDVVEGETTAAYTVSLSEAIPSVADGGSDIVVTLTYTYTTAEEEDITETATVTIAAGSDSATFTIDTIDDALAEGAEDFVVSITEANVADSNFEAIEVSETANSVTTTITDQIGPDTPPGPEDTALVSISGEYTIIEGESSGEFTVSVDQSADAVTSAITVELIYSGVAQDGTDFTGVASVTIEAGSNSATFTLDTIDDALAEGSESLVITIGEITDTNFEAIAADPDANSVENAIVDEAEPDVAYRLGLFAVVQVEGTDESPEFEYVAANEIVEDGGVGTYVVLAVDENGDPLADAEQPGGTVTVNVGAGTDTADRGVDYDSAATMVATVGTTFTIAAIDDVLADSGEIFTLALSEDWSRASEFEDVVYSGGVTTTIVDEAEPDAVTLNIAGPSSVFEGDVTAPYTLSLVDDEGNAIVAETDVVVIVTYTGTATDGSDYTSETPITIAAGSSSATFDLQTLDDSIADNGETIVLTISTEDDGGFEAIELGNDEVTTTIIDGDIPLVSISGEYTIIEGETSGTFTVAVDQPASEITSDITVALIYSGVAQDGTDFTGVASVTIAAGTNSVEFTIDTIDDALAEGSESLVITIGEITDTNFEAIAADPDANSVENEIVDEAEPDVAYSLGLFAVVDGEYVAANEISEDGGVGTYVVLAVDENGEPLADAEQPGGTVTVNVGAGTDTADRGVDYDSAATVVATVGTTFTIAAIDDALAEGGEVFTLALSEDWSRASEFEDVVYGGGVTTTITDQIGPDTPPGPEDTALVSISGEYTIIEGESSGEFTVSVDQSADAVTSAITVELIYSGVAQDGTDFTGVASVTIEAGLNSATFTLDTIDDALAEGSESLVITIGEITDTNFEAIAADPDANSVENAIVDEAEPGPEDTVVISLEGPSDVVEGETTAAYTVSLSEAIPSFADGGSDIVVTLTYTYTTAEEEDITETATVTIAAGSDSATFTIDTIDDALAEGAEDFVVSITEANVADSNFEAIEVSETANSVTTTITDQIGPDTPPGPEDTVVISLEGPSDVVEGETTAAYTVSLSEAIPSVADGGSDIVVTLTYTYTTAEEEDITETATVTIAAGSDSATFTIDTIDDALAEGAEDFVVSITEANVADSNFEAIEVSETANSVTTTITDQIGPDTPPGPEDTALVSISGEYTIIEGESSGEFTVSVDQSADAVTSAITVELIYSGVAQDGTDFTGVASVTIEAGSNSATFTLDTIDDALAEGSESLVITIGEITDTNFEAIAADPDANSVENAIVDEAEPDVAYRLGLFAVVQVEGTDESPEFEYVAANEIVEDGGVGTYVVLAVDENGDPLADAEQPGGTVTVNVGAGTDTADRGVDYDSAATMVATVGTTFTIAAIDDVLADSGEIFTLALSEDWSRASEFEDVVYSGGVTTTIVDEAEPDAVTLNIAGPSSVFEGDVTAPYTLSLVDDEGNAIVAETDVVVIVTYTGTATDGSDYTSETPITIAAGSSSATFDLQTLDDSIADNGETIVLTISTEDNGGFEAIELGNDEVTTTIVDDDIDLDGSVSGDIATADADVLAGGTDSGTATVQGTGGSGGYSYAFASGAVTSVAAGDFTIDADTGVVTFTQDAAYSHAADSDLADDVYSIDVVITDSDGNTVTQTVNVDISDDAPSAVADTASVTEGGSLTGGDVLGNDAGGADGLASSAVIGVGTTSGDTGNVGTSISGTYGTLTLNADGSYEYVASAGTGGGVDTFYYTVIDADGDTSETTLTITVGATDLGGSVSGDIATADADVLAGGTDSGTATVQGTGGSGGYSYAFASGAVTSVAAGDFTIDADTGVVTFTQDAAYSHAADSDLADDVYSIDVVITDSDGNTVTQTVNVDISDDAPSAVADTASVTEGGSLTGGDVLGNDAGGADGLASSAVIGVGTTSGDTGNVGTSISGTYGTLTLNADGSYEYVASAGTGGGVDTFYYTVIDADGDTSETTLTITVGATDLGGSVSGDIATADADVLAGGTDSGTATVQGTGGSGGYSYAFASGAVTSVAAGDFTIDADTGVVTFTQDAAYSHAADSDLADDVYSIDVVITDSDGNTVTQTVNVDISDDAPSAVADTASVTEGGSLTGGDVLGNDAGGADGLASSAVIGVGTTSGDTGNVGTSISGTYGTLTLNADGSYEYVASAGTGGGVDTFYYTVIDADGDTSETTLTITVGATDLGGSVSGDIATADADVLAGGTDSGTATVQGTGGSGGYSYAFASGAVTSVAAGDFTIDADTGVVTFTQDAAYSHAADSDLADDVYSIDVVITDSDGNTVTQTVNVDISDDAPSAVADTASVTEGGSLTGGDVLGNDAGGADGLASSAVIGVGTTSGDTGNVGTSISGTYGTLTLNADGSYEYVASAGTGGGVDTFYYTVIDADGDTSETTLTITVGATDLGGSVSGDIATADADVLAGGTDSGTATVQGTGGSGGYSYAFASGAVTSVAAGDFTIDADTGVVTFTQDAAYSHAADSDLADDVYSIDVVITDSDGNTVTQTVNVDISDDAPSAVADTASVTEGGSLTGGDVLGNDAGGADGLASSAVIGVGTTSGDTGNVGTSISGTYGTLTLNADGSYEYVASAGTGGGVDTFYYTVIDADGDTSETTLTITVGATDLGGSVSGDIATADADVLAGGTDSGTATVQGTGGSGGYSYAFASGAVTSVAAGDFTIDADTGVVTFTQDAAYSHAADSDLADDVYSIDVVITDSDGNTVTQTVNVDISDDAPSAVADTASVTEGGSLTGGDVLGNDAGGADGLASSAVIGVGTTSGDTGNVGTSISGTYGTLTLNADGSYEYVASAGTGGGVDTFYYTVIDADGDTSETTLTITVGATDLGGSVSGDIATADADVLAGGTDSGTATVQGTGGSGGYSYAFASGAVTSVAAGDFTIDADTGVVTFTQDAAYSHAADSDLADDVYSIDVVITDSDGNTVTQTVNVDISDDAPSAVADTASVTEGGSLTGGDVLGNDAGGADGLASSAVIGVGTTSGDTGNVGTSISGTYGTLTLNADGSYEYVASAGTGGGVDTFYYTVIDADGDTSETTLTITVGATDLGGSVSGDIATADADVLAGGTDSGTATVQGTGGSGGYSYAFASGAVTSVAAGDFTIDADTGVVTFTQDAAYSHAADSDLADDVYSIDVVITDSDGNTVTQTVNVDISDDAPSAVADTASVTEGGSLTGGDVLGNDAGGADGLASSAVIGVGTTSGDTGNVGTSISGTYGTLTLNADGSYEYVASAGTGGGVDTFYYTVIDADGDTSETTLTITVGATDLGGSVSGDIATADADVLAGGTDSGTATVQGTGGSGGYSYAFASGAVTSVAAGDFTIDADTGVVTFTQDAAYSHAADSDLADDVYSIDVVITDSDGNTVTQTVNVDISDDAPSAVADTASVTEGGSLTGGDVLGNDAGGADGLASSAVIGVGTTSGDTGNVGTSISGTYGTLTLNADGSYEYVASAGTGGGVDTFYYTVIDADGDTSETTLTITVGATDLGGSVSGDIATADADVLAGGTDSGTATVQGTGGSGGYSYAFASGAVTSVAAGDFTIDADTGVVTFTQDAAYSHAADSDLADDVYSIDVVITDSDGNTVTQTVNVDISDDAPSAVADTASVTEGGSLTGGDVLGNDAGGADGLASSAVIGVGTTSGDTGNVGTSISGTYGTLTLNADGSYEYVASAGTGGGVDTFYYTVIDADGDTSETTLTITVGATDLGGSVSGDIATADADVLAGGTDSGTATVQGTGGSGGYSYAFASGAVTSVAAGDFTIDADTGVVTFTQDAAYSHAADSDLADDVYSIDVVITDSDGNTVTQTVNVDISDDAPSAVADTASVTEGGSLTGGDVLGNDAGGADGLASSAVIGVGTTSGDTGNVGTSISGTYGTLTLNADGSYEYVASAGTGGGVDTFYYTVIDADGDTSETTLTITVGATDLGGSVSGDIATADADVLAGGTDSGTATVQGTGGSGGYSYAFASGAVTSVAAGDFTIDADTGVVTFTQDAAYSHAADSDLADDVYSIDVVITDSDGNTVTQTVNVDISDDAPSAVADTASVTEGGSLTGGDVLGNDAGGADGLASSAVIGVGTTSGDTGNVGTSISGTYGTLTLNADGSYEYVASAGTGGGVDTFYYTVIDADGDTSETTLTITVGATDLGGSVSGDIATADADVLAGGTDSGTATVQGTGGSGGYSYAFASGAVTSVAAGDFTIDADTGVVTFTQDAAYSHAADSDLADDVYSIDVVITDSDGNTVTQTVNVDISDDAPEITPIDFGSVAAGDSVNAIDLQAIFGADGGGDIAFSSEIDGQAVLIGGEQVFFDGLELTWSISSDGNTAIALTPDSTAAITIVIDDASGQYSISVEDGVFYLSGDVQTFDIGSLSGSNADAYIGVATGGGTSNVFITSTNGATADTTNTSSAGPGYVGAGNQWIDGGSNETVTFEFLEGLIGSGPLSGQAEIDAARENATVSGVSSFSIAVNSRGNSTPTITLTFEGVDGSQGTLTVDISSNSPNSPHIISVNTTDISWTDSEGNAMTSAPAIASVTFNASTSDYRVGGDLIFSEILPSDVPLELDVTISDSDGDISTGAISGTITSAPNTPDATVDDPLDPFADCEDYPNGFIGIIDGTLLIIGTGVSDYIQISDDGDRIKISWKTEDNNVFEGDIGDFPGFTQHGSVTGGPYEFYIDKDDYDHAIVRGNPGNDYIQVDVNQSGWIILGDDGDDFLQQGQAAAVIFGGDGDDDIQGGAGPNYIAGGAGNDTIQGQGSISSGNLQDSAGTIYGDNRNSTSVDYRDAIALRDQTFTGALSATSAPIAIDLDGNGLTYLGREAGVTFTDALTGEAVNTAWVAPSDGILVIDLHEDGAITTSAEYVFTEWSSSAQTDLEAIAEVFDTNQDGVLDAQDERFDEFAVWQDADSDGVTDEGELTSLTDLGIESIELTYRDDSESRVEGDGDVTVLGQANVNFDDGSTTTAEDVSFAVEAADLLSEEDDLTELLSDGGESDNGATASRADASAVDIAQLELTLNFEHNESDSFDQHE